MAILWIFTQATQSLEGLLEPQEILSHCTDTTYQPVYPPASTASMYCEKRPVLFPLQPCIFCQPSHLHISIRRSVTEYLPHGAGRKVLKWTLEGRKWFLYRAKIPNVIASAFLIKREGGKKDIFPDVGEKQYLQLQVQVGCCFCKGWKVKSDTVSASPKTETD